MPRTVRIVEATQVRIGRNHLYHYACPLCSGTHAAEKLGRVEAECGRWGLLALSLKSNEAVQRESAQ